MPKAFACIWLLLIIAIAVFIRIHGANSYYFSQDESMLVNISSGSSLKEALHLSHYEIQPPMLYILCHYWLEISREPAFVRGLSLIFGILVIIVYYLIGKKLNGEMTGLTCAALVAFSRGCIIQSYVVRSYIIFLFFLSSAFYCYIHWRSSRKTAFMLAYGGFAALACLTHFSGALCVFCIAAYEMPMLYRQKAAVRTQALWIALNLAIGLMTLMVYHMWQPALISVKSYFNASSFYPLHTLVLFTLLYPLAVSTYLFPSTAVSPLLAALLRKRRT